MPNHVGDVPGRDPRSAQNWFAAQDLGVLFDRLVVQLIEDPHSIGEFGFHGVEGDAEMTDPGGVSARFMSRRDRIAQALPQGRGQIDAQIAHGGEVEQIRAADLTDGLTAPRDDPGIDLAVHPAHAGLRDEGSFRDCKGVADQRHRNSSVVADKFMMCSTLVQR
ncbi:hypothetical protein [Methylobacterium pseudosasicola]|uniref:hypothetical protein n=1 Tax=Methylobacterium pseudosasicola TaxID=582667 RepID=UPI001FCD5BED|nr:hypothetical protein [Methylobacterium pseudosasicola]